MMMEREKVQRLKKGTLVVGRATFTGQDVKVNGDPCMYFLCEVIT